MNCANDGCSKAAVGKSRYCSDSCRAKASHARNYVKVRASKYDGPRCWCGRPARYPENGKPKCGNHNLARRAEKARWRRLLKELQDHFTIEEARECVRLAIASKLCQGLAA